MPRLIFLLLGSVLFVYLAIQLGLDEIISMLRRIGWNVLVVVLTYGGYQAARASALSACLLRPKLLSYRDTLWIRLSGEAVHFLTFTGPFLSEPAKAWLLKRHGLTTREAFAATITEYLIYTFLSAALSIVGLSLLIRWFYLGATLSTIALAIVYAMAAFLVVSTVAIVFRVYLLGAILHGLSRLPLVRRYVRPDMEWIHRMEDLLLIVLRERPRQLLRIMAIDLVAQGLLVLELVWILKVLGIPFPLMYSFLIEAATKFTGLAFFFIPTQLGAAEATYAVLFDVLGFVAAAGFSVAFLRRLRSLLVAGAGLVAMSLLSRARA